MQISQPVWRQRMWHGQNVRHNDGSPAHTTHPRGVVRLAFALMTACAMTSSLAACAGSKAPTGDIRPSQSTMVDPSADEASPIVVSPTGDSVTSTPVVTPSMPPPALALLKSVKDDRIQVAVGGGLLKSGYTLVQEAPSAYEPLFATVLCDGGGDATVTAGQKRVAIPCDGKGHELGEFSANQQDGKLYVVVESEPESTGAVGIFVYL